MCEQILKECDEEKEVNLLQKNFILIKSIHVQRPVVFMNVTFQFLSTSIQ
jgi:hypothetical protein